MKCFFYPNRPIGHAINRMLGMLNWEVTPIKHNADFYFWWKFTAYYEELPSVLRDKFCLNSGCTSTLKTEVERRFVNAFNKVTLIDPTTYIGVAVKKSDLNATHDGVLVNCPIEKAEDGFVYQKLLGNTKDIINYRIPVIGGEMPYVIVQHKNDLFKGAIHGGVVSVEIKKPEDVFSQEWINNLKKFCDGYIDIAEIDVVDGCIVDVNNTPSDATYVKFKNADRYKLLCSQLIYKHFGKIK